MSKWKYSFGVLLTAMLTTSVIAVKPVMTIDFDDGFDGRTEVGKVKATAVGNPKLVPGKFGKALESGPATGYLEFPASGALNGKEGSVEMWIKRVGWKPDDNEFHVFFETLGGKGWLVLYKFCSGSRVFMLSGQNHAGPHNMGVYTTGYNHRDTYARHKSPQKWGDDWAHFVGTWSEDGNMVYMNGIPGKLFPRKEFYVKGRIEPGPAFRIGDEPWPVIPRTSSSLIDGVKIYDRALTPKEVAECYNKAVYNGKIPLSEKTVQINYSGDVAKKQLLVDVFTGSADPDENPTVVQGAIVPAKSQISDSDWRQFAYKSGSADGVLPLPSKAGKYDIAVRIKTQDKIFDMRREVEIPDFSWYGNKLGLEHKVLEPWTPLMVDGTAVKCWGREYSFGNSALPEQIISKGKELLASPVIIDAKINGTPVKWVTQNIKKISADEVAAEFMGELIGQAGNHKIKLQTKITIEYDGFMLIDIIADNPEVFSAFSLDIPVRLEHASYHHRYSTLRSGVAGNVPAGQGVVDKSDFMPFTWLGDNDRGLFWCCETDQFWPNGENDNAFEEVRDGNTVSMRFNLLKSGQKFGKDWKYEFALQATPVKPLPKNWRKFRFTMWEKNHMRDWPGGNVGLFNWGANGIGSKFGYPESEDPPALKEQIKITQAKNYKLLPYLNVSCQPTFCSEWPFFGDKWRMGYLDLDPVCIDRRQGYAAVSTNNKEYRDFVTWKLDQYRRAMDLDGEYHDNTFPYLSNRPETGCGYVRNGERRPSFTIFSTRALLRRNRAAMQAFKKDYFVFAHMSSKVWIPLLAYEDAMVDGEHFRGRIKDNYPELLPMDMFRAEYMGRQWGLIPVMLLELSPENTKKIEPTRGIVTMCMLHDVKVWGMNCFGNQTVIQEAQKYLDEFGYVDAEFIPYFDADPPAATASKDVYISAYKKTDGRVMLIIGNLARNSVSGKIRINFKRLGITPGTVIDWQTKQPIKLENDKIEVTIPGEGYKMIVIDNFNVPIPTAWG